MPASVAGFALGSEPDIMHFLPAMAVPGGMIALALLLISVHWSPSLDTIVVKYLVPRCLALVAMSVS